MVDEGEEARLKLEAIKRARRCHQHQQRKSNRLLSISGLTHQTMGTPTRVHCTRNGSIGYGQASSAQLALIAKACTLAEAQVTRIHDNLQAEKKWANKGQPFKASINEHALHEVLKSTDGLVYVSWTSRIKRVHR